MTDNQIEWVKQDIVSSLGTIKKNIRQIERSLKEDDYSKLPEIGNLGSATSTLVFAFGLLRAEYLSRN